MQDRKWLIFFLLSRREWKSWDPCDSLLQPKTTANATGTSSSFTLCNTVKLVLLTVRLKFVWPLYCFKGIVHFKINILTQKKTLWKTCQLFCQWKSVFKSCFNVLQSTYFCVLQKKESQKGLEWHDGESVMTKCSFLTELIPFSNAAISLYILLKFI